MAKNKHATEHSPVRRSSRISSASKESKEDSDDSYKKKLCEICKSGENENKLLLCDSCDDGYHIYCLTPKLSRIPAGEWFCPSCKDSKQQNNKKRSRGSKESSSAVKSEEESGSPTNEVRRSARRQSSQNSDLDSKDDKRPKRTSTGEDDSKPEVENSEQPKLRRSGRRSIAKSDDNSIIIPEEVLPRRSTRTPRKKNMESSEDSGKSEEEGSGESDQSGDESSNTDDGEVNEEDARDSDGDNDTTTRRSQRNKRMTSKKAGNGRSVNGKRKHEPEPEDSESDEATDVICAGCGKGDDESKLLLCDHRNCKRGSHIYCLPDPISKVPTGKWFCDTHRTKAKSQKKMRKSPNQDGEEDYVEGASDDEYSDNNLESEDEGAAEDVANNAEGDETNYQPTPRKYRKRRGSASQALSPPKENTVDINQTKQPATLFAKLEVPKSDASSIASDFTRIAQTKPTSVPIHSPAASPAPSPPATPLQEKSINVAWDSSGLATSPEKSIAVAWELSSVIAPGQPPASPNTTPIITTPAAALTQPNSFIKPDKALQPTTKLPPKNASSTPGIVNFWRGGLTVDGKFICNLNAYCKRDWQRSLLRQEWPKVLEVNTCVRPTQAIASHFSTIDPMYLSLLPEKYDQTFNSFISALEKSQTSYFIPLASRDMYLIFSSMPTLHPNPTSAHTPSILALLLNTTKLPAPSHPKPVPSLRMNDMPIITPTNTSPPKPFPLFMAGVHVAVVGVPKSDTNNLNIVKHTVGFLVQHCGAEFSDYPLPGKTNLIIVHAPYVANITEIPCLLDLKLDPSVQFVRGLQYLENCCKSSQQLPILPAERLFPTGGLILVEQSSALQEDTFRRVFAALDRESKKQIEWKIKIERNLLQAIKSRVTDPRAPRACEVISAYMGHKIFEVTSEEEPHSHTPANQLATNDTLPPILVRTALKLAFIHAAKYRHIIILTTDTVLATIARRHQILATDMEGLDLFFKAQTSV